MRAAFLLVLVTAPISSGCVIDRSPLAAEASRDADRGDHDAGNDLRPDAAREDDAEVPDAFTTLDAWAEPDAFVVPDAFELPDVFVPGDTPVCVAETCNRRDDDCDDLVDEAGCAVSTDADCAAHVLGDRVYLVCPEVLSWTESRDACDRLGYALVTIDDADENREVAAWLPGDSWIGLNDRDDEGTFEWLDGSRPGFASWGGSEPNDFFGEDCTLLRQNENWNDGECDDQHTFVCEAAVVPR